VARSYRELLVWQKAKALAVQIYNSDRAVSEKRDLRLNISDETGRRFRGLEHC
jgi:hypothetical protein